MALDTYSNLKTAIIAMSGRDDLTEVLDDFIDIAESEMYGNKLKALRTREMEMRNEYTLSTADRYLALPANFLQMRQIRIQVGDYEIPLKSSTPGSIKVWPGQGVPEFFAVSGSTMEFDIIPDVAYTVELQYYEKPTPLSSSNQTNSVLTNHPNVYLFGSLWALYIRASEEDKANYQYSNFMGAIAGANSEAERARYGNAPAIQTRGYIP